LVREGKDALWTGIDLFMGFIIGPVLRATSLSKPAVP
jgi:hypothetical protein